MICLQVHYSNKIQSSNWVLHSRYKPLIECSAQQMSGPLDEQLVGSFIGSVIVELLDLFSLFLICENPGNPWTVFYFNHETHKEHENYPLITWRSHGSQPNNSVTHLFTYRRYATSKYYLKHNYKHPVPIGTLNIPHLQLNKCEKHIFYLNPIYIRKFIILLIQHQSR